MTNTMTKPVLVCLLLAALTARNTLQLSEGDFSAEDYDDLNQSTYSADRALSDQGVVARGRKANLTSDQIHDYLFSLHSKVLTSNDVLGVKERKVASPIKKDKFFVSALKPSAKSSPEHLQSDQPSSSAVSKPKVDATTSKPQDSNSWNGHHGGNHFAQEAPNSWNCEFKSGHDCGVVNDLAVGDFFHLESRNFFANFNWKSWYLLLNASSLPTEAVGARLITPYIDTKNVSQGCLSMQYITMASGAPSRLTIYQQDTGNQCIFSTDGRSNSPPKAVPQPPVLNQLDFTVDLPPQGSPRFFLEVGLNPYARNSIFALANMRLAYRPCFNSNANYCRPKPAKAAGDYEVTIP